MKESANKRNLDKEMFSAFSNSTALQPNAGTTAPLQKVVPVETPSPAPVANVTAEEEELVQLNVKIPPKLKRAFDIYVAENRLKKNVFLQQIISAAIGAEK